MPRVLIAEDDRVIANAMATHLRGAGMDVEWADNGDAALRKLRFERPDVAVIDLMLPGEDGWRITEALRSEGATIPIIMISARGSEHDKVHGLRIGADDYLAKPFGMRELVARVQAALRRSGMVPSDRDAGRVEAPGPRGRRRPAPGAPRRPGRRAHAAPSSGCCGCSRASRARR